ncbi:hypothetical protein Tco_0492677, partial [Tanacetum coccineum]
MGITVIGEMIDVEILVVRVMMGMQNPPISIKLDSTYREDLRGLGCEDQFKERLATYNLEGDAHIFSILGETKCKREYKSIHQLNGETSTEFMNRFLRLAGFLGAKAGTYEYQAKNIKWGSGQEGNNKRNKDGRRIRPLESPTLGLIKELMIERIMTNMAAVADMTTETYMAVKNGAVIDRVMTDK